MKSVAYTDDCVVVDTIIESPLYGKVLMRHQQAGRCFLLLEKDAPNPIGGEVELDANDVLHAAQTANTIYCEVNPNIYASDGHADKPWIEFSQLSMRRFRDDIEQEFDDIVKRVKNKKVGDKSLLDIENISLGVADYSRFLFHVKMLQDSPLPNLNLLSNRVIAAAEIISNIQGGISVLHQGSVEQHLQFALWLNRLEEMK